MTLDELIEELQKWQEKFGKHKVFRYDSIWSDQVVSDVYEDAGTATDDVLVIK